MPNARNLKKRTMVKDVVGKCRTTTYVIPADGFIYGMQNIQGAPGADKALNQWQVSEPSASQQTLISYPATNREALQLGILDAKGQRDYAKTNPVMKSKPAGQQDDRKEKDSVVYSHGRPFGVASEANQTPMSLILSAPSDPETDYPSFSSQERGKMPLPRPTKSSILNSAANAVKNQGATELTAVDSFKMKKFRNVKSTGTCGANQR